MASSLLCIDVLRDKVVALSVTINARVAVVEDCAVLETAGHSFGAVAEELAELLAPSGKTCRLTFSPEFFSFRNISLPFTDRKKIAQVLPLELEDQSPLDLSSWLVDFIISGRTAAGAEVLTAMLPRQFIAERLAAFMAVGIDPDTIGISGLATCMTISGDLGNDFVLLDCVNPSMSLYQVSAGRVCLARSITAVGTNAPAAGVEGVAREVVRTLLASQKIDLSRRITIFLSGDALYQGELRETLLTLLGGNAEVVLYRQSEQPLMKIGPQLGEDYLPELMDRTLSLAVINRSSGDVFNLRKDDFRRQKSFKDYRRVLLTVGLPLVLLCLSLIGYQFVEYQKLIDNREDLRHRIATIFSETVPGVAGGSDPVKHLTIINREIRSIYRAGSGGGGAHTVIELLTEISARIPASYQVRVVRLAVDPDLVRLKGQTGDFNTVDNVQRLLEESEYFSAVDISSANQTAQGDEVRFELKMKLVQ